MRLWAALLYQISLVIAFSFDGCNITESCWFQPPSCSSNDTEKCSSVVKWSMQPDGLHIQWEAIVRDLDNTRPYYAAVGFSYNERMDDDTVIECILPHDRAGIVQISFNDETYNEVLPQATSVLLKDSTSAMVDGTLKCSTILLLDNKHLVANESQFKIHDLEKRPYHLLFARGSADVFTLEKDIHYMNDGPAFPWMSKERVVFCRENCSSIENTVVIKEMEQSPVSRYWRYRIAVLHGVVLLVAWWVLGSSAILIARYFKPLFPRKKLLGTAVWFQLHRDMFIISVILQVLAVVFIFYQANWVWYQCSYKCTSDDFSKKMHSITGFGATCLALFQPFFAFLRPSPNSNMRQAFNWAHWTIGMTAWGLASTTFVLSLPMGKTGLNRVYGHVPNWIMGGYILFFIFCNVIMEMIASTSERRAAKVGDIQPHRYTIGPSGMTLANLNGPSTEAPLAEPTRSSARVFIFFVHLFVSLGVAITITVMLVKILLEHSP